MKNSLKILSGILFASLSSMALAAPSGGNGKVTELVAGAAGTGLSPQDVVYFKVENMTMNSTCTQATTAPYFVINTAEPGGKSMLSVVLAANMAGKPVWVAAKGTCNTMSGHEDISYVFVK